MVRDVPGISVETLHEAMSTDPKYKTGSANSIIYRLTCAKYIRKNKDGKLFARIAEYRPLPPVVTKKKRVVAAAPSVVHTPVLPERTGFFAKLWSFFK